MPKGREELRRGLRSLIEVTSREMEALADETPARVPDEASGDEAERPILKLVREPIARPRPLPEPESIPDDAPRPPTPAAVAPSTEAGAVATPAAPAAPVRRPQPAPEASPIMAPAVAPAAPAHAPGRPMTAPVYGIPADASGVHPKRGVCAAYYVNHACWEVPEAYCNQALQVCMLRDCPVYNLNREEMERRFAAKFAHLW